MRTRPTLLPRRKGGFRCQLEGNHVAGQTAEVLPHCGVIGKAGWLADQTSKPSTKNPEGKRAVYGLWKCYACRKQFTVRKGTIFEESRLELHLWFQAAHLMCSSKKGVSATSFTGRAGLAPSRPLSYCRPSPPRGDG